MAVRPDKLTLHGTMTCDGNVSASPEGIIGSLEHAVRSIEGRIGRTQEHLVPTKKSIGEFAVLTDRPFEHEAVVRQAELIGTIDTTKSQNAGGTVVRCSGGRESEREINFNG